MNDFILIYANVNIEYSRFVHYYYNVIILFVDVNINIDNVNDDYYNVNVDVYKINIEFVSFYIYIIIIKYDGVTVIVDEGNITNKFYYRGSKPADLAWIGTLYCFEFQLLRGWESVLVIIRGLSPTVIHSYSLREIKNIIPLPFLLHLHLLTQHSLIPFRGLGRIHNHLLNNTLNASSTFFT